MVKGITGPIAPNKKYEVEAQDITEAIGSDQHDCAIVCAIQRQNPDAKRVIANKTRIAWTEGNKRYVYPTPEYAIEAVIKPLDTGGQATPITLQLTGGVVKELKPTPLADIRSRGRAKKRGTFVPERDVVPVNAADYNRFLKGKNDGITEE